MSKYTDEFKLKVVKYCLEWNHSQAETEKYFNIPKNSRIKIWIQKCREHGAKGLIKRQKFSYSGEFKEKMIKYKHNNELSATETTNHFKLGSVGVVSNWKRIYFEERLQGLCVE